MTSKRAKYASKFQTSWCKEWKVIRESTKGKHYASCTWCKCDFAVEHGGRNDVAQHIKTKKHAISAKAIEGSAKVTDMFPAGNVALKVSLQLDKAK